jgi:hypothetical protein
MKTASTSVSSSPVEPRSSARIATRPNKPAITSPAYPEAFAPAASEPETRHTRALTTPPPSKGAPGNRLSTPSNPFVQARAASSEATAPVVAPASSQQAPASANVESGPTTEITNSGHGLLARRS